MARILVVEDDEMNRDIISRQLVWHGLQVVTANDGREAIAAARAERPDLILMDMGLPIMTGWEATAQIKADPALRTIPVIALTAFAMAEDRARSMDAGCDAYETKPIDFARLFATMRRLLAPA